jgi:hypothetical protein
MFSKIILITILVFAFFADKCGEKPIESETAKRGMAIAQPVIIALEKYRQDNQNYPQSLPQLSPKYLKETFKNSENLNFNYNFNEQKKSYEIEFNFNDSGISGMSECSYYSETKAWSCVKKM